MGSNERGGALPLVLMLLVVLSIFGILAFTLNTTATKQFDKKEANVQARHLAEMGVLHVKAEVKNKVEFYNSDPKNYMVYDYNDVTKQYEINEKKSQENYRAGLCSLVSSYSPPNDSNLEVGTYSAITVGSTCDEQKVTLSYRSQGNSKKGGEDVIDATITVAPFENGSDEEEDGEFERPIGPPQKPIFSGSYIPTVNNLDDVNTVLKEEVKVKNGTSKKNPYTTSAAVEILNPVELPMKVKWNFISDLIISNDLTMNTGGNNKKGDAAILSVLKNLYIDGKLNMANNTTINVDGDFSVIKESFFGTDSSLNIGGSAYFGGKVTGLKNKSDITVAKDAYFITNLTEWHKKANFCVNGNVYLLKNGTWAPYLPEDFGYEAFNNNCLGTSPGETGPPSNGDYDWWVLPNVDADYSVG